ncbi:agmatinase [Desulfatitalea alkaliphila]|uniref:Agmatinase n=1 Tax=Desulfatitalea alkaliphila TaxID=2929485 RepID=A0AA41R0Y4_9BACT|nr:agmatinase [Desulfatitalea alkaliphila]
MKAHGTPFLAPPDGYDDPAVARVVVVPFGYEGNVSYGLGTADGPQAVLEASQQVEFYDDWIDAEPYRIGIATLATPPIPGDAPAMIDLLADITDQLLAQGRFPVVVGGDHSISSGFARSVAKHHPRFGVIQLDAHADLRDRYEDNPLSHASVMARIRELTPHTLQIGIRSMAVEEAQQVKQENLAMCTMRQWRRGAFDLQAALDALPEKLFITVDVDAFDWSVIASTGTPEPGGLLWDETLELLQAVFAAKDVVGCDVVELSHRPTDPNSPFAVAKLIYKMIGFKFADRLTTGA